MRLFASLLFTGSILATSVAATACPYADSGATNPHVNLPARDHHRPHGSHRRHDIPHLPQSLEKKDYQRDKPILGNWKGFAPLPSLPDILHRNTSSERGSFLPLSNIQGDIFIGMKKPIETFFFFNIISPPLFKRLFRALVLPHITSTQTLLSAANQQPSAFVNVAFSARGLKTLKLNPSALGDDFFTNGQWNDAANLGDNTNDWEAGFKSGNIDGVLMVASDQQNLVDDMLAMIKGLLRNVMREVYELEGGARPGSMAGHEHFGFLDGISNPAIQGYTTSPMPGQALISPGIILTGRPGDQTPRPSWGKDGSFMVFRKLKQFVPEFNGYVSSASKDLVTASPSTMTSDHASELFAARMIGRWKSGAPVDLAPFNDDPALGADPSRNNDFSYQSHSTPSPSFPSTSSSFVFGSDQSYCPFSAHIRKTRPRGDLAIFNSDGSEDTRNMAIRAGIPYGGEVTSEESSSGKTTVDRGLCFVEYQSNIDDGFRTQQVVWSNSATFPPLKNATIGLEPINSYAQDNARLSSGQNPFNTNQQYTIPAFVRPVGGEYFFMPSISSLANVILG